MRKRGCGETCTYCKRTLESVLSPSRVGATKDPVLWRKRHRGRVVIGAAAAVLGLLASAPAEGIGIDLQIGLGDELVAQFHGRPLAALKAPDHERFASVVAGIPSVRDVADAYKEPKPTKGDAIFFGPAPNVCCVPINGSFADVEDVPLAGIKNFPKISQVGLGRKFIRHPRRSVFKRAPQGVGVGHEFLIDIQRRTRSQVLDGHFEWKKICLGDGPEGARDPNTHLDPRALGGDEILPVKLVGLLSGDDGIAHIDGLLGAVRRNQFHLALASPPQLVSGPPQEGSRNRENDSEHGKDALVVVFEEFVGAAQKDQRSLRERGTGLLIILLAAGGFLFWLYQARSAGIRRRPPANDFERHHECQNDNQPANRPPKHASPAD